MRGGPFPDRTFNEEWSGVPEKGSVSPDGWNCDRSVGWGLAGLAEIWAILKDAQRVSLTLTHPLTLPPRLPLTHYLSLCLFSLLLGDAPL